MSTVCDAIEVDVPAERAHAAWPDFEPLPRDPAVVEKRCGASMRNATAGACAWRVR